MEVVAGREVQPRGVSFVEVGEGGSVCVFCALCVECLCHVW